MSGSAARQGVRRAARRVPSVESWGFVSTEGRDAHRQRARRRVVAQVPGKAILAGEHAVVYGRPALVASLGGGVEVGIERPGARSGRDAADQGIELCLSSPSRLTETRVSWQEALDFGTQVADVWRLGVSGDRPFVPLAELGRERSWASAGTTADVVAIAFTLVALAESWWGWCSRRGVHSGAPHPPPLRLTVDSRLPLGAGCGSSAAVAGGVALALDGWLVNQGIVSTAAGPVQTAEPDELEPVVHAIERRQHGRPSGVDGAMVLRGGVLFATRPDGEADGWTLQPVGDPGELLREVQVVFTGSRPESTGEVVAAVSRLAQAHPMRTEGLFDDIEQAAWRMRDAVSTGDGDGFARAITDCQSALVSLGVVPPPVRRLVEKLERLGCAAKISGAGSTEGPGAGLVLLYDPEQKAGELLREEGIARLDVGLGGPGACLSSAAPTRG